MSEKQIITDPNEETPVPASVQEAVLEYERATGIKPEIAPRPSTPDNPRAHLPKYRGKMRGEMPDDHPARQRQIRQIKRAQARERERDQARLKAEAEVPQHLRVGSRVVIGSNAKVDYTEEDGTRITGDYAGIEGEIFQTYVDDEGVRRHIVVDIDPSTGRSRYAPVAVRECDLTERGREARVFSFGDDPKRRAQQRANYRAQLAGKNREEIERAAFHGMTAKELANRMCGL